MTIVTLCSYLSSVHGCFYTCGLECCWIFLWTCPRVCGKIKKILKSWKPYHYFLRVNIPILRKHAPKGNTDGETSRSSNSKLQPYTCTTMISMCTQCLNRLCAVVVTGSSMLLCWAPCCLSLRRKRCVYSPSAGVTVEYELPSSLSPADTATSSYVFKYVDESREHWEGGATRETEEWACV